MMNTENKVPIKNAATVVIRREIYGKPHILMGQRGRNAVFMPNKFVFPGGAIDQNDGDVDLALQLDKKLQEQLLYDSMDVAPNAIIAGAIREVWEETGLRIIGEEPISSIKKERFDQWESFFSKGFLPNPSGLEFFFRAITPPGRPRRFDARFFICNSSEISGNLDDFSNAGTQLKHLQWISLEKVKDLELPFITEIVLAEVASREIRGPNPEGIPFFDYSKGDSKICFII